MNERRTDPDILTDIRTRLALVENDLSQIVDNRRIFQRWMVSFVVLILVQLGSFIYGYAQLQFKVDDLDLTEFRDSLLRLEGNVNTALAVLGQHGEEFKDVRNEQARVRGNIDQIHNYFNELRRKVDEQTGDRFYKQDGDRIEARIKRLEDKVFE